MRVVWEVKLAELEDQVELWVKEWEAPLGQWLGWLYGVALFTEMVMEVEKQARGLGQDGEMSSDLNMLK